MRCDAAPNLTLYPELFLRISLRSHSSSQVSADRGPDGLFLFFIITQLGSPNLHCFRDSHLQIRALYFVELVLLEQEENATNLPEGEGCEGGVHTSGTSQTSPNGASIKI
jgi:hypothetical protein